MKLLWTGVATADRRSIRHFIASDNPRAALALDELISKISNRLPHHPGLGRPGRVAGTRELVVHPNYILVYDVNADTIRILRVLHAAQQWPPQATSMDDNG